MRTHMYFLTCVPVRIHAYQDASRRLSNYITPNIQKAAEEKGDAARAAVILEILTREQERKKWRRINHTTRPPRGGAPITLRVQAGTTINTYSTEHKMFEHTSDHLSQRFCLAHSAPCYRGQYVLPKEQELIPEY